ncbi:E3 ubiquitin-protein ligase CHFR-like isoform X2 [Chenopodium quinoa]|uniref:E3 ubiquitin-protein ligase CHFR-like isoform X2 n=1 Tax=Chenopodium quinoa TaxID=63459 RepID=UPI000B776447|nr:E3 ubiquitin-protein ligase CHFR-like isoform X2 [Chenopodium quinoa]
MDVGQSSGSNSTDEVWAKLVPSDSSYASIEISSDNTIVCSQISSTSDKLEWCQIIRNSDRCSATIRNKRSNFILIDGAVLESEDVVGIKCGCEIVPASTKKEHLSFKFEVMPVQEHRFENKLKIFLDSEHTKCCICLNVWHDVVTVAPCLHNFCNGCFSEWLKRCQKKHSSVLCPQCRAVVQFVGRNHFLHGIEEDILQADASLRRSAEELAILDSYATIKSNLVITNGKGNRQKRARSLIHEERVEMELPCPQCGTQSGGFRCTENIAHLQCHACGGMMPSRSDISIPQHCCGCDRTYCGAYWHAQGVTRTDHHPICQLETFRPITNRCIRQMGTTLQEVIAEWITKLDNREIDRSRLHLKHPEMITAGTHVCSDCYNTLVSFLLYWFRISLPIHLLPPEASSRQDCWYGHACRTQHHSVDHARKRNHVCRPTRGSHT